MCDLQKLWERISSGIVDNPKRLSPDKGKGKGKGKVRSVEEGGEPEEEATGEATANETSEIVMTASSGSGTESTSVVIEHRFTTERR